MDKVEGSAKMPPSVTLPSIREMFPDMFDGEGSSHSVHNKCHSQEMVQQNRTASGGPSTDQGKHMCALCGKRFRRPSSLGTHMNSHTGAKPFACTFPGCNKKYSTLSNMRRHAVKHNQPGSAI